MYAAELIEELISCPKTVVEAPGDMKEGRSGFIKRIFTLISVDDEYSFSGFITQNLTFTENFSIGLSFNPKDEKGKIVLLRCNGPHGGTKAIPHHAVCHIHTATAERVNEGLKPKIFLYSRKGAKNILPGRKDELKVGFSVFAPWVFFA